MTKDATAEDQEHAAAIADRDWWDKLLAPFYLRLRGWTYRSTAQVEDREGRVFHVSESIRDVLLQAREWKK